MQTYFKLKILSEFIIPAIVLVPFVLYWGYWLIRVYIDIAKTSWRRKREKKRREKRKNGNIQKEDDRD